MKKMPNKLLLIVLMSVLLVLMVGCGNSNDKITMEYSYLDKESIENFKNFLVKKIPCNVDTLEKDVSEKSKDFSKRQNKAYEKFIKKYNSATKEIGTIKFTNIPILNLDYDADDEVLRVGFSYFGTIDFNVYWKWKEINSDSDEKYGIKINGIEWNDKIRIGNIIDLSDFNPFYTVKISPKDFDKLFRNISPKDFDEIFLNDSLHINTVISPLPYCGEEDKFNFVIKIFEIGDKEGNIIHTLKQD